MIHGQSNLATSKNIIVSTDGTIVFLNGVPTDKFIVYRSFVDELLTAQRPMKELMSDICLRLRNSLSHSTLYVCEYCQFAKPVYAMSVSYKAM